MYRATRVGLLQLVPTAETRQPIHGGLHITPKLEAEHTQQQVKPMKIRYFITLELAEELGLISLSTHSNVPSSSLQTTPL